MQIRNKHSIIIISILSFLLLAEAVFIFIIPKIINIQKRVPFVEKLLYDKTDAKLHIENPVLKTYADLSAGIKADKFIITTKQDEMIIKSEDVFVRVPLLPLLFKNLNIKHISAQNIEANIIQNKDGKFNLEKLVFKSDKKLIKLKLRNTRCNISKYNIDFTDQKYNKHFLLKGNYFKISDFTMKKLIDLETDGQIISKNIDSSFRIKIFTRLPLKQNIDHPKAVISGFIKDFNLSDFTPYIKNYFNNDINSLNGIINLNFYTKKLKNDSNEIICEGIIDNLSVKTSKLSDDISANGKNIFNFKIVPSNNKIEIEKASLKGVDYHIESSGLIKNFKSKKPYLDINARVLKSRAENIASLLPSNLIPGREEIRKIKNYGVYGNVEGEVQITGTIPKPDITGSITADDVHIVRGLEPTHVGLIKLNFDKKILNIDVKVSLTQTPQEVLVSGLSYIYRDGINHFIVKSTDNVPLVLTQKLLLPIQDVFLFQLGPVPEMKVYEGTGSTNLDIKGTRESGIIYGKVIFKNTKASYNGINGILDRGNGEVVFDGKKVSFNTESAFLKNHPVSLFGTAVMEGDLDLNLASENINPAVIMDVVNTSPLLEEVKEGMKIINDASGICEFLLNIKAKIPPLNAQPANIEDMLDDLKVKGNLVFKDAKCTLEGFKIPVQHINGSVNFTDEKIDITNLQGKINSSQIKTFGNILINKKTKIPKVNISVEGNKIKAKDTLSFILSSQYADEIIKTQPFSLNDISADHSLNFNYSAESSDVDLNGVSAVLKFLPFQENKKVQINRGTVSLSKGNLKIENVNSKIYNTVSLVSGEIQQIFSDKPACSLDLDAKKFNLAGIEEVLKLHILPKNLSIILSQYTNYTGTADLQIKIRKNSLTGYLNLYNANFVHKYLNIPISIHNANLKLNANKMIAKPFNATIADSPLYAELIIEDILGDPTIDGYFTTKITESFVDSYINTKMTYPLKVKGDIILSATMSGTMDNLAINPVLKFNEGSDISYLSANLGDTNEIRELKGNLFVNPDSINIKRLDFIKYQISQNNRTYPMTFAVIKGNFIKQKDLYVLDSFYLRTNNNLPTRLLNFIFKKSILKHGTFNCSIFYKFNQNTNVPKIFGNIDFKNVDIPLYDTIIKNISIKSNNEEIKADINGSIFESDFVINSIIKNRLAPPIDIKQINISSESFNFDKLLDTLNRMSIESYQNKTGSSQLPAELSVPNILVRSGNIKAKDVNFKSLPAQNLNADFSLDNNSLLKIKDISFDIAGGKLTGESEYNFKSSYLSTDLIAEKVDANMMGDALFDLKNQIFGKLDGQLYITTKGSNQDERLRNLSGRAYFKIEDGRMPKLGSLEYLLKASNLVKSGITGLTINSIIDIINPIKTGNFSVINGNFRLDNGNAKNVEIYSKGENLSIFVKGSVDLVNSNADMKVLGRLSKKIPTILGPIGNTSLNSIFNIIPGIVLTDSERARFMKDISKIPGLDFSNDDYRIFQAKIDGNINGSHYVSSFKWVEE